MYIQSNIDIIYIYTYIYKYIKRPYSVSIERGKGKPINPILSAQSWLILFKYYYQYIRIYTYLYIYVYSKYMNLYKYI